MGSGGQIALLPSAVLDSKQYIPWPRTDSAEPLLPQSYLFSPTSEYKSQASAPPDSPDPRTVEPLGAHIAIGVVERGMSHRAPSLAHRGQKPGTKPPIMSASASSTCSIDWGWD